MRHVLRAALVAWLLAFPAASPADPIRGTDDDPSTLLDDIALHPRWPIPPETVVPDVGGAAGIGVDGIWNLEPLPFSVPRHSHSLIYDSHRDRLVFFGGADNRTGEPYNYYNDVWELSLAHPDNWRRMEVQGTPPDARVFHSAIYDPMRDRMIVTGGARILTYFDDVWALSFAGTPTWTRLQPSFTFVVPERAFHVTVYDPARDRLILHGGVGLPTRRPPRDGRLYDTWELSLSGSTRWTLLSSIGPRLFGHAAVYDPVHDEVVVYGGWGDGYNGYIPVNNSFKLVLTPFPPIWTEVTPSPSPPIPYGHQGVYDPRGKRMLAWQTSWSGGVWGTWQLSLDGGPFTWSQLRTRDDIGPRYFQGAVYDPVRHRMIVHGGQNQLATGATLALSLCISIRVDVRPGNDENSIPLESHGSVPVAILSAPDFDATTIDPASVRFAEAAPAAHGAEPRARIEDIDGDGLLDLVLNFRIDDLQLRTGDTIATVTLTFAGGGLGCGEDSARVVPPARDRGQVVVESTRPASEEEALRLWMRSGPRSRTLEVELSLPRAGPARLDVLDVTGRRVLSRPLEALRAGRSVVALGETGRFPAGLYFLRLTQGDWVAAAKALRIP